MSLNKSDMKNVLFYLVSLSDQFADIHIEAGRFIIIAHWSLLHCWRQRTVFVCHTVKKPKITQLDKTKK